MSNEIWKDIDGYNGKYRISNLGRVMAMWRGNQYKEKNGKPHILKPSTHKQGYLWVTLYFNGEGKHCFIHRLVAQAFLPNPNNLPQVNHKNEEKDCNIVWVNKDGSIDYNKSNLEWCDGKYNSNYGTKIERHRELISKPIIQYTLDGTFIKEYKGAYDVKNQTGYDASYISMVCLGRRPKAYGYLWKYKEEGKTTIQDVLRQLADLLDNNIKDEDLE